jgi:hypothetical protein
MVRVTASTQPIIEGQRAALSKEVSASGTAGAMVLGGSEPGGGISAGGSNMIS